MHPEQDNHPTYPLPGGEAFPTEQARGAFAQAVADAGGEKLLAAAAVLGGLPRAVRPDSRAAVGLNREVRAAESSALRAFAVSSGLLLDGEEFERRWKEQGEMGGSENDIIYDEATGRVWKRNRVDVMHVSWVQFFDRMLLHNAHFPEAPLRLEGFADLESWLCPVFTQPDVHAERGAPRQEVEPLMKARGYARKSGEDYANDLLHVEDLHDGNVLVDKDGEIQVIDPVVFPK